MNKILITGADGHLGSAIARWLLDNTDRELLLWVRATDAASREVKQRRLRHLLNSGRCQLACGQLQQPQPFAGVDPVQVGAILHAAAAIDFNVSREHAERVNIAGTRQLLEFAARCPKLRRCALLSTLYSAGLRHGELSEQLYDDSAAFANHYEWSKHRAEQLIATACDGLPWQIMRVATVIADDASGAVGQQNVLHNTMRLMYYGLLSILPGDPSTRIYLTTTAFAAAACGRLLLDGPDRRVFHLSDCGEQALRLDELLDRIFAEFNRDPRFGRSGILKPLYCDQEAFDTLVAGIGRHSDVIGQALASVAPFAPQLFLDKQVVTQATLTCLGDLSAPRIAPLLPAVSRNLVSTRWRPAR